VSNQFKNIYWLSAKDYFSEWKMSAFSILALAAVLGPMLILFGLKSGIVGSMIEKLVENPKNLEIRPMGSGRYDLAWFQQLREREDVRFVIPLTRSIAASLDLKSDAAKHILPAELKPTAQGDPMLGKGLRPPKGLKEIILAEATALKLNVEVGDTVDGSLAREFRDRKEREHLKLEVISIASGDAFSHHGGFVSFEFLEALEFFRDGRRVEALGWEGDEPDSGARHYPNFRLYARSIYDVAKLRSDLSEQGIEVRTRSQDIDIVKTMDRNLSMLFWAVAAIGLAGYTLSLSASLWANVDRKRRELSILRLVGFRTGSIVWVPVIQACFTAVLGWILAVGIYFAVAYGVNALMGAQLEAGETICKLYPLHFVVALLVTLFAAVIAAALAGLRAAGVEPAEGLREV
jgi:putative ABC transport system permease protein